MTLGTVLVGAAVGAGLFALAAECAALAWPRSRDAPRLARTAIRVHASAAVAAAALMLLYFLVSDVRMAYVWSHTHAGYPFAYKVSGLWGGQEGTILLWGALVAAFANVVSRRGDALARCASLFLALLSTSLMGLALAGDAFRATKPLDLALAPHGAGLADVLVTPLMVIHPPLQFVAYALIAVPAAYALARWALPREAGAGWIAPAYAWARVAWLFATVGLGLGALWAYYVLSFGGYWAWDPVENANLLPWLALTAFLHAGKTHMRLGDHALAAPLLAFLAYVLTVFGTFATRSGLWVSVHAFTDPTNRFEPDAAARLLGILGVHLPSRAFLALATASLLMGLALFLLHHARDLPRVASLIARVHAAMLFAFAGLAAADVAFAYGLLFEAARLTGIGVAAGAGLLAALLVGTPAALVYLARDEDAAQPWRLDTRRLMTAAVGLFAVATLVTFLLNLQIVNGQDRSVFDARAPLLALPIVSLLTVALALAPLGRNRALILAGAGLAAGLAGLAFAPSARVVWLAAPPLAAAALATVLKLAHVQGRTAPPGLRIAGALLLLAGLLGLVMWANPPSRLGHGFAVPLAIGGLSASALALLGAVAAFRVRHAPLALAGALAATLAAGYGVGALLGLAALVIIARERGAFAPAAGFLRHEAPRLRETGIYLIHFALIVGLMGYAASTYSQQSVTATAFEPGGAVDVAGFTFHVAEAEATRAADGTLDALRYPVHVTRDGRPWGEGSLTLEWQGYPTTPSYRTTLDVRRGLAHDVYLQPMAFHTAEAGWVSEGATDRLTNADVDVITFRASVLPLMSLVWSAIWTMGLGMGLVLLGARLSPPEVRRVPLARAEGVVGETTASHQAIKRRRE